MYVFLFVIKYFMGFCIDSFSDYYTVSMMGIKTDQEVLGELVK